MSSPFAVLATSVLDSWLAAHPSSATGLGDHRHDDRLDDPSPAAAAARRAELRVELAGLDAVEVADRDEDVDRQVLRTELSAELFDLDELREAEWNPMTHNPGGALYALASRPFAPAAQRYEAARARLAAIPGYLAAARERLGDLSRPHVEGRVRTARRHDRADRSGASGARGRGGCRARRRGGHRTHRRRGAPHLAAGPARLRNPRPAHRRRPVPGEARAHPGHRLRPGRPAGTRRGRPRPRGCATGRRGRRVRRHRRRRVRTPSGRCSTSWPATSPRTRRSCRCAAMRCSPRRTSCAPNNW